MSRHSRSRSLIGAASLALAAGIALAPAGISSAGAPNAAHSQVVVEDAVNWTPNLRPTAELDKPAAFAVAQVGNQMVVGGKFASVWNARRTADVSRSNVVAFDAQNGTIHTGFNPQVDGEVWSVLAAPDGQSVFIGGKFKNVNGVSRPALAKLNLNTGEVDTSFTPPMKTGIVFDMEIHGNRLIVAGSFGKRLLALNVANGKSTPYIGQAIEGKLANSDAAKVFKFDISPDGEHLVAVGNFTTVAGQPRPRVFMLDLGASSTQLSPWTYAPLALNCTSGRANAQAYVLDVDFAPDSSYFALASFGFMYQNASQRGLQLCDSVARFETDTLNPTAPTWINYTGGDSLKSVAVTGAAVYVQGHSRWLDNPFGQDFKGPGAVDRLGGGAVDPVTGMALPWDPPMPAASGGNEILATDAGVWFATDGTGFNGKYRRGIRFVPLPN